jgi:hypothetical protein
MEEGGGLFDTPEYYKAALEQEQLDNISLRKIIFEQNKELGTSRIEKKFLLDFNTSQTDQIIQLQKRVDDLTAENVVLTDQKAQSDNELAERKEVELSFTNQMHLWMTQLPVLTEFTEPIISPLISGGTPIWFKLIITVFNEMIQRIKVLESAVIESKSTNNLHIEGDFVMRKVDDKDNK